MINSSALIRFPRLPPTALSHVVLSGLAVGPKSGFVDEEAWLLSRGRYTLMKRRMSFSSERNHRYAFVVRLYQKYEIEEHQQKYEETRR